MRVRTASSAPLLFAGVPEIWITKLDAIMKTFRLTKLIVQMLVFNLLAVCHMTTAFGDIVGVNIQPSSFNPAIVTINVNDQVVWTWVSDVHNTVSDAPGLWDSGVFNTGHVFTNTFTSAGAFPYSCTVHGFAGTVNVQAGNLGPTVAISSPTNGASFTAPAMVSIVATAEDSDGSVTNVSFFDGSTLLGATNNTPYSITADLPIGSHSLTAVSTDNLTLSTTSFTLTLPVAPPILGPTVAISSPTNDAAFTAPAMISIVATAEDSDGNVTNVSFFDGSTLLGGTNNTPYSIPAEDRMSVQ